MNSKGLSLTEVMISLGMVSLLALGISFNEIETTKVSMKQVNLIQLRAKVIQYLNHQDSWNKTINAESSYLSWCKANILECKNRSNLPLEITTTADEKLSGTEESLVSFNNDLSLCSNKNPKLCAYSVSSSWTPKCSLSVCSQAGVDVKFYTNGVHQPNFDLKVKKNVYIGDLEVTMTYERDVEVTEVTASEYKLFFIIDNSKSMADNIDALRKSIISISQKYSNLNIKMYFYTTSSNDYSDYVEASGLKREMHISDYTYLFNLKESIVNPDYDAAAAASQMFSIEEPKFVYKTKMNTILNSATQDIYEFERVLRPDFSEQIGITINTSVDKDLALDNKIKSLTNALLANEGHSNESGLCTMKRILYDLGPNKPLNKGDNFAFILLSDEDDRSLKWTTNFTHRPGTLGTAEIACSQKHRYTYEPNKWVQEACDPTTETCFNFKSVQVRSKVNLTVAFTSIVAQIRDGGETRTAISHVYTNYWGIPYNTLNFYPAPYNQGDGTYACNPNELNYAKDRMAGANTLLSCAVQLQTFSYAPYQRHFELGWVNSAPSHLATYHLMSDQNKSISPGTYDCNQKFYSIELGRVATGYEYVMSFSPATKVEEFGNCEVLVTEENVKYNQIKALTKVDVKKYESSSYYENVNVFLRWTDKDALNYMAPENFVSSIMSKARDLSASNKANFTSIVVVDPTTCSSADGLSVGQKYIDAVKLSDTPTESYDICSMNYDLSVQNIFERIQNESVFSYSFPELSATDLIHRVQLERSGSLVMLEPEYFNVSGNTIYFVPGILEKGDKVSVIVKKAIVEIGQTE